MHPIGWNIVSTDRVLPIIACEPSDLSDIAVAHHTMLRHEYLASSGEIGRASCRERVCQYV